MSSSAEVPVIGSADAVETLAAADLLQRRAAAERYLATDALRNAFEKDWGATYLDPDDLAWRALRAEVAAALTVHEQTAGVLLEHARRLVNDFPTTLDRLQSGAFPDTHARILVDKATGLSPDLHAEYETALLEVAPHLVAGRFAKYATEVRASLEPETLTERHREALQDRRTVRGARRSAHPRPRPHRDGNLG